MRDLINYCKRTCKRHTREFAREFMRDTSGNILMLTAFMIIPMLLMVGSAVDIGRSYAVKLQLQHACDAAVLAARKAMVGTTFDDAAQSRGVRIFDHNFPDGTYGATAGLTDRLDDRGNVTANDRINLIQGDGSNRFINGEWVSPGTDSVIGIAAATMPASIMRIAGVADLDVGAECIATLETGGNLDIMLVLDITGSMGSSPAGDTSGTTKIEALRTAAINFHNTLVTRANDPANLNPDGTRKARMRVGVVPYSMSVNVGQLLFESDSDWISDNVIVSSRVPIYRWSSGSPQNFYRISRASGAWEAITFEYRNTETLCTGRTAPAATMPIDIRATALGTPSPDPNTVQRYVNSAGNVVMINNANPRDSNTRFPLFQYGQNGTFRSYEYRYRYEAATKRCFLERRMLTDTARIIRGRSPPAAAYWGWRYEDRVFDFSQNNAKDVEAARRSSRGLANRLSSNIAARGASRSERWDGCIRERVTTDFAAQANTPAPPEALDMDIDTVPNAGVNGLAAQDATRWKPLIGRIAYPRNAQVGEFPPRNSINAPRVAVSSNPVLVAADEIVGTGNTRDWQWLTLTRLGRHSCPKQARRMTDVADDASLSTSSDDPSLQRFATYINGNGSVGSGLVPAGSTYHDIGMAWGARLLSPTGLFSADNATAPNGLPIRRHIIFMTDGITQALPTTLAHQGYEDVRQFTGAVTDGDTDKTTDLSKAVEAAHDRRFVQLCARARDLGITIWVIGFDVNITDEMRQCAASGARVFRAANAAELNEIFQNIANQFGYLRITG